MTAGQRTSVGIAMLAVGAVCCVIAALMSWSAIQRWLAITETRQAAIELRHGRPGDARRLAANAAKRIPDAAAPALLALDLTRDDSIAELETLAVRCAPADRDTVQACLGLARVLQRRVPDVDLVDTADGRLLVVATAAVFRRDPPTIRRSDDEVPPHRELARAVHTLLLRRALELHAPAVAATEAGALLLLSPRGPNADALRVLIAAATPAVDDATVVRLAEAMRDNRAAVVRAVGDLVPTRRAALTAASEDTP